MKKIIYLILAIFFLNLISIHAQNTDGKSFWLTFGQNFNRSSNQVDLQLRIVSRDLPISGTIYFTALGTSVPFSMGPRSVFTFNLNDPQKVAAYCNSNSVTDKSIYITTDESVTVYALNQTQGSVDATNILPTSVLGINYYQISYPPVSYSLLSDSYAVIATEDNTEIFHNGNPIETLNTGQVYYHTSATDMTGFQITADKPIAFFAMNQCVKIPESCEAGDYLMQQLEPVNTWG